jgi:hypothetical protein
MRSSLPFNPVEKKERITVTHLIEKNHLAQSRINWIYFVALGSIMFNYYIKIHALQSLGLLKAANKEASVSSTLKEVRHDRL